MKKLVIMVAALALLVGLGTACGSKKEDASAAATLAAAQATGAAAKATEAAAAQAIAQATATAKAAQMPPAAPAATPTPPLPTATQKPTPTATSPRPTATSAVTATIPKTVTGEDQKPPVHYGTQAPPPVTEKGQDKLTPGEGLGLPFQPPAEGQGGELLPGGAPNPFLQLFPDLRRASAPDWLREGVRVTYRVKSASIAQVAGEEGSAGAGYAQYDLVALDNQTAVSSLKLYLDTGAAVVPSLVAPSLGIPGIGDYWIHPSALQTAERMANEELTVVHMPMTISGKTYQAVRFQYNTQGAEYVWMFDEASGLLLFYRHAIGTENDTHRQLTDATLVGRRQVRLPWRAESAPDWATAGSHLQYDGTYSVFTMGSLAASLPYAVSVEIKRVGAGWSEYEVSDYLYGRVNSTTRRVTGVAQIFDALWLPPEAVDTLRDGQVLDRDPITGAEVTVSRGGDGSITLTESGQAYRSALTYDERDGALVAVEQETTTGVATILIELQLSDRQ